MKLGSSFHSLKAAIAVLVVLTLGPAASALPRWSSVLAQPAEWYGSEEARAVGARVLEYQTEEGGWPKNVDMTQPPPTDGSLSAPTIDNGGTTTPLWLLGRMIAAGNDSPALRDAVARGLDYLFAAQYANGGWPQFYPLRRGYYSHITYNDNAMVNVLTLLRAVAEAKAPFGFVEENRREKAAAALARGVECMVRTQVVVDGQVTAWCAQHDAETLAPAPARAFEPVSLSGAETVGILRFLMGVEAPSPEVIRAIEAGVAWLEKVRIGGVRVERPRFAEQPGRDQFLVADPEAPGVWARFYEIGTNRPIFLGRDRVVHYSLSEVEAERRSGYSYYGTWGQKLLEETYPEWRERLDRPSSTQ